MDYKDKLRLAKEALDSGSYDKETIEYIFPELKESEDKIIIDALKSGFKLLEAEYKLKGLGGIKFEKILAWLEKQGGQKHNKVEQKSTKWTEEDIMRIDNLIAIIENKGYPDYVRWLEYLRNKISLQLNQNWTEEDKPYFRKISLILSKELPADEFHDVMIWFEHLKGTNKEPDILNDAILDNNEDGLIADTIKAKSEQKIGWSEEDELNLSEALHHIRMYNLAGKADKLDKWLKSLKDRVQPKQKWSEEDERLFQIIIDILDKEEHKGHLSHTDLIDCVRKLKSLRPQNRCTYNPYKEVVESIAEMCEKYEDANLDSLKDFYFNVKVKCKDAKEYDSLFPQSTWKPSDEQIYSLDRVLRFYGKGTAVYDSVKELLEQLKKLKE